MSPSGQYVKASVKLSWSFFCLDYENIPCTDSDVSRRMINTLDGEVSRLTWETEPLMGCWDVVLRLFLKVLIHSYILYHFSLVFQYGFLYPLYLVDLVLLRLTSSLSRECCIRLIDHHVRLRCYRRSRWPDSGQCDCSYGRHLTCSSHLSPPG